MDGRMDGRMDGWTMTCIQYISLNIIENNDNDNILFNHNLQIEITIYNSLENQIINKLVWRLLLRQNYLSLA